VVSILNFVCTEARLPHQLHVICMWRQDSATLYKFLSPNVDPLSHELLVQVHTALSLTI